MPAVVAYNALNVRPGIADGAATYSVNLLRHLPDVLPDLRFVVYLQAGEHRIAPRENLELRPLRRQSGARRVVRDLVVLRRDLVRVGADLLFSPFESLPWRSPCPAVVVAQNFLYHCEAPDLYRGLPPRERILASARGRYYGRRMPSAYRQAANVIVVSQALAAALQRRAALAPAKTRIVLEGADSVFLPAPVAPHPREEILLTVGSIAPYKRLELLVDLYAAVLPRQPGLRLVVAGADWRGYERVLRAHIEGRGLGASVELTGQLPADDLARLYARSRLLLVLSSCEAFGLPALEAMRYGLPVAVADGGAPAEVVGGAGFVFDPDAAGAAAELGGLLLDDSRLRLLGEAGRRRAGQLTWRKTAEEVGAVIRAALDEARR